MKANELRHKNLVNYHGKAIEVFGVLGNVIYYNDGKCHDSNIGDYIAFEPIPLTPEWHIRFGAKRNGFNDFVYQVSDIKTISFSGDYVFMRDFDIDINAPGMTDNICVLWNNDIRKRSMYVHEWQNMWNIMTGTELTLTEKPTK